VNIKERGRAPKEGMISSKAKTMTGTTPPVMADHRTRLDRMMNITPKVHTMTIVYKRRSEEMGDGGAREKERGGDYYSEAVGRG